MFLDERHYPDPESGMAALAREIVTILSAALAERRFASLAVSGGRTPEGVLPLVAREPLAWERIRITLTDERWVPVDHSLSNENLVRRTLLQQGAACASFTGLISDAATPWAGQAACEARLASLDWPLDVVFLGMGPDGHIASLFPGEPAMATFPDCSSRCVACGGPAGSPSRLGLSPCALLDARRILLMVSGPEKRATYLAAKEPGSMIDLPIRLVLDQDRVPLTVFLTP